MKKIEPMQRTATVRRRRQLAMRAAIALIAASMIVGAMPIAGGATVAQNNEGGPLTAMGHWGLLKVAVQSDKKGLGNVADPTLAVLDDASIRLYFKNGNSDQAGITGHDNLVHSAISKNGGKNWKIESGARNDEWQSPIEVLPDDDGFRAFGWSLDAGGDKLTTSTSADGSDFASPGDDTGFDVSACDTPKGVATIMGDPSITPLKKKFIAVVQVSQTEDDDGSGIHLGYGCTYISRSATDWSNASVDWFGAASFGEDDQEVVTNPMVYRSGKVVERWTPAMDTMLYESTKNGKKWKNQTYYFGAGDPERLDLSDGTELLAFGNFDGRFGGVIVVAKRVESDYTFQRQRFAERLSIRVDGTDNPGDVKVWNLCANKKASQIATASVDVTVSNGGLDVTIQDSGEPEGLVLGCYYALVGKDKVIG